jgi:hypothetical protein
MLYAVVDAGGQPRPIVHPCLQMETWLLNVIQARGIEIGESGVDTVAANVLLLRDAGDLGKRKEERQQQTDTCWQGKAMIKRHSFSLIKVNALTTFNRRLEAAIYLRITTAG